MIHDLRFPNGSRNGNAVASTRGAQSSLREGPGAEREKGMGGVELGGGEGGMEEKWD